MIPVLIVPCLRPDLVGTLLASVDVAVGRRVVIDNGGSADVPDAIHLPANLGVGASWNLGLKLTIDAPWWLIVNDDVVFFPGTLARLVAQMADPSPRIVALDGFSAFGINTAALDAVGFFDENYHPAYVEDCDYEYRCRLAGVPIFSLVDARLQHERSSTIADPHYRKQNSRTYPANVQYHRDKWGGGARGGETLASPFGRGGALRDWTLDPARLRAQRWPRRDDGAGAG